MSTRLLWTLFVFSFLTLSGCSTANEYYPGSQVIVIDGKEFMVKRAENGERNSWMATPNMPSPTSFIPNPAIYAENAKAIEKATKCRVITESVRNTFKTTYAAVDCAL